MFQEQAFGIAMKKFSKKKKQSEVKKAEDKILTIFQNVLPKQQNGRREESDKSNI